MERYILKEMEIMKKLDLKKFRVTFNAPVILWFTILCFAAWVLNIVTGGWTNDHLFSVYRSSLLSPLTYVRFLGHVVGHANWDHYISNMMILLIVGPLLEEKYGSKNILLVILSTALVTGVLSFILFPGIQLLGASGVVFAMILLSSFTSLKEGEIPLTFILVAVIYLGEQIYQAVAIVDNVSNFGHIIGGVCGSVLGYRLNKDKIRKSVQPSYNYYNQQGYGQNMYNQPGNNQNYPVGQQYPQYNNQYPSGNDNTHTYY